MTDTLITSAPISREDLKQLAEQRNMPLHKELAGDRWFRLSLADQLSNVGSEFSRAFNARKLDKQARFEMAFERLLELLNLTLSDPRWIGGRKREIARLKENIVGHIYGPKVDLKAIEGLERYFYYFGVERQIQRSEP